MKRTLIASLLFLTACQTAEPGIRIERVPTPVPVPCIPADQIPAEPETVGDQLTGDPVHDLPIVAASAIIVRLWGREMHAALTACAG